MPCSKTQTVKSSRKLSRDYEVMFPGKGEPVIMDPGSHFPGNKISMLGKMLVDRFLLQGCFPLKEN